MISLDNISTVSSGLKRPECVLTTSNGRIYTADWRGGIGITEADGKQWYLLAKESEFELRPNGICLLPDGSFLMAHLGDKNGGIYRLSPQGEVTPLCIEIAGEALPPSNYVHLDAQGRIWLTVSTRQYPRSKGYTDKVADGFVAVIEPVASGAKDGYKKPRIVADNLCYTNECLTSPDGKYLFVNETFGRKLTRFTINDDANLSDKQTIAHFGPGVFPDGLTFDVEGGIWITSIVSNRVIRIAPNGEREVMVEDCDMDHLQMVEFAFQKGTMGRPHLDVVKSKKLKNISSLAFGGKDLHTAYMGCLLGDGIYTFNSPYQGHPPTHWLFEGPNRSHYHPE